MFASHRFHPRLRLALLFALVAAPLAASTVRGQAASPAIPRPAAQNQPPKPNPTYWVSGMGNYKSKGYIDSLTMWQTDGWVPHPSNGAQSFSVITFTLTLKHDASPNCPKGTQLIYEKRIPIPAPSELSKGKVGDHILGDAFFHEANLELIKQTHAMLQQAVIFDRPITIEVADSYSCHVHDGVVLNNE